MGGDAGFCFALGCELNQLAYGNASGGGAPGEGGQDGAGSSNAGYFSLVSCVIGTMSGGNAPRTLRIEDTAYVSVFGATIYDIGLDGVSGGSPSSNRVRST